MVCDPCKGSAIYVCEANHYMCSNCNPQKIWHCYECDRPLYHTTLVNGSERYLTTSLPRDGWRLRALRQDRQKSVLPMLEALHLPLHRCVYKCDLEIKLVCHESGLPHPTDEQWNRFLNIVPNLQLRWCMVVIALADEVLHLEKLLIELNQSGWTFALYSNTQGWLTATSALKFSLLQFTNPVEYLSLASLTWLNKWAMLALPWTILQIVFDFAK